MAVLDRILRAGEGRILRKLTGIAEQVNLLEDDFAAMSDAELRAQTDEFKKRLRRRRVARRPDAGGVRHRAARRPSGPSASGTSTSSSWAAPRCTSATSPR